MNITVEKSLGALRLSGALEIHDAPAVQKFLLESLAEGADLAVDLSQVNACDAAGAQLLCAARISAGKAGKRIYFEHPTSAVLECWAALGLPKVFFESAHGPGFQ